MKSWTIRQRILGSFAGILAMVAAMGAIAFIYLQQVHKDGEVIATDSAPGAIYSAQILARMLENHAQIQRHLSLEDKLDMQKSAMGLTMEF